LKILVVICTRKRPVLLGELLASCTRIEGDLNEKVDFLIIENGPETPSKLVVEQFSDKLNITYAHEPKVGLVWARNLAVSFIAAHEYEWVGSFDDDQLVDPNWLIEVLAILAEHDDAEIVTGRIIPKYPNDSRSILKFNMPNPSLKSRFVNRALVVNSLIRSHNFRPGDSTRSFDMRLNLIGGEDVLLIQHIRARGGKIRSAPRAIVHEVMVPERSTNRFAMHRSFTLGQQTGAILMAFYGPIKGRLLRLLTAPKTLLRSIAFAFFGLFVVVVYEKMGLWMFGKAFRLFFGFCGQVSTIFTRPYKEYERVVGS